MKSFEASLRPPDFVMHQLTNLYRDIIDNGTWGLNERTKKNCLSIDGAMVRLDLREGFPAVTEKKLYYPGVTGELVGMLRGATSAEEFRKYGSKVWDQNANENEAWLANPFREGVDDLGPIYGAMWRHWPAYKDINLGPTGDDSEGKLKAAIDNGFEAITDYRDELTGDMHLVLRKMVDQLRGCLDTIMKNPSDRRIIYHGWNPAVLDEIALPSCHIFKQFICRPETREISMVAQMRSVDVGLGLPFNIAHEATMLHLVARLTGYTPKFLTMQLGDTHIYEDHMDMVNLMMSREPMPLPQLKISDRVPEFAKTGVYEPEWLDKVEPSDFELVGYQSHPGIKAPMAV
jgi:thymidylate synthase